jgi:hypothetical protein
VFRISSGGRKVFSMILEENTRIICMEGENISPFLRTYAMIKHK